MGFGYTDNTWQWNTLVIVLVFSWDLLTIIKNTDNRQLYPLIRIRNPKHKLSNHYLAENLWLDKSEITNRGQMIFMLSFILDLFSHICPKSFCYCFFFSFPVHTVLVESVNDRANQRNQTLIVTVSFNEANTNSISLLFLQQNSMP